MASKTDRLQDFIGDAFKAGQSREAVRGALAAAGWTKDQIEKGLAAYAEVDFPVPVPRPVKYVSAREAFYYLLLFSALYVSASALGSLLFDLVNLNIPDVAESSYRGTPEYIERSIRWSISVLVPFFPAYVFMTMKQDRAARANPTLRTSKVRKWLTYLTLFIAALFLLGDFSSLVYQFLDGSLTARFLSKVTIVAGIAGGIFGYYLWDLHRDDVELPSE